MSRAIRLTAEQAARREADMHRLSGLENALDADVAAGFFGVTGCADYQPVTQDAAQESALLQDVNADDTDAAADHEQHEESQQHHLADIGMQTQHEAALLELGEDGADPDLIDWCAPAQLMRESGDADRGAETLRSIDPLYDPDDLAQQIYLYESQEANRHDRLMMDVTADGRRKGGTHGVAPEDRKIGYAKIVNAQLMPTALIQIPGEDDVHEANRVERAEAEAWRIAGNARLTRELAYCLTVYQGKYGRVLELMAQLKTNAEIAEIVGLTDRRIRQIVNGNFSKGRKAKPGLRQICREIVANGVPSSFQSAAPVLVQPVHTLKKSMQKQAPLGQLAWDMDALCVGVAA